MLQPVREVKAVAPLVGIIAGQVGRKVLQKAAQKVGVAIISRAGVKTATSPAARKAYKAWFQRSGYAAEKMAKGAKNAGQGNTPGWLKVVLGGATAASLMQQTYEIGQSVKGLINSFNSVLVGEPGVVEGQNAEYVSSSVSSPSYIPPAEIDISSWNLPIPVGLNINNSGSDVHLGNILASSYSARYLKSLLVANSPFVYIPNFVPVGFRFTGSDPGMCYFYGGPTEVKFQNDRYYTKFEGTITLVMDSGQVIQKTARGPYITATVKSEDTSDNKGLVIPICGFIAHNSSYNSSNIYIVPVCSSDAFIDSDYMPGFAGTLSVYEGSLPEFIPTWESLSASELTVDAPASASEENPLIVQVPDPAYVLEQYPGLTEEELESKIIEIILNNPDIVSQAESEVIPGIENLPDYFPKEVQDPLPDPDPEIPDDTDLNFEPLIVAANLFTEKFPFSLPWDLKRIVEKFNYDAEIPVFTGALPNPITDEKVPFEFTIPESMRFVIPYIRFSFVVVFVAGLIWGTRKLMGGDV